MWQCKNCNKQIDDNYNDCWNCGYSNEGLPSKIEFTKVAKIEDNHVEVPNRMMKIIQIFSCVIGIVLMVISVFLGLAFVVGGSGGCSHTSTTRESVIAAFLFLLNLPTIIIAIIFRDSILNLRSIPFLITVAAIFQGLFYYYIPVIIKLILNIFIFKKKLS